MVVSAAVEGQQSSEQQANKYGLETSMAKNQMAPWNEAYGLNDRNYRLLYQSCRGYATKNMAPSETRLDFGEVNP